MSFGDLAHGLAACLVAREARARARAEARLAPGQTLACLSVRTGLDLLLGATGWAPGDEVVVSALTIPDMARVLEAHGLVVVPADVEEETCAPTAAEVDRRCSPRTRAVLVAHLFGGRAPLGGIAAVCRRRGLLLVEDAAQAWAPDGYAGHPLADVSLFSFGLIKTATALGGALVRVRDPALLAQMRALEGALPRRSRISFALRVIRAAALKLLASRPLYTALARLEPHLDRVVGGAARSFPGTDLLRALRRRPSAAQLALLDRRLARYPAGRVAARRRAAMELVEALGADGRIPGAAQPWHSHWVVPVLADDPDDLVTACRAAGFDATRLSSLAALRAPAGEPPAERAARVLAGSVYLPCRAELSPSARARLAGIARDYAPVRSVELSTAPGILARLPVPPSS